MWRFVYWHDWNRGLAYSTQMYKWRTDDSFLDFKLFSSQNFSLICTQTFSNPVILHTYPPLKMEQKECPETSAYKIQTPWNYPEHSIQHDDSVLGHSAELCTTEIWLLLNRVLLLLTSQQAESTNIVLLPFLCMWTNSPSNHLGNPCHLQNCCDEMFHFSFLALLITYQNPTFLAWHRIYFPSQNIHIPLVFAVLLVFFSRSSVLFTLLLQQLTWQLNHEITTILFEHKLTLLTQQ